MNVSLDMRRSYLAYESKVERDLRSVSVVEGNYDSVKDLVYKRDAIEGSLVVEPVLITSKGKPEFTVTLALVEWYYPEGTRYQFFYDIVNILGYGKWSIFVPDHWVYYPVPKETMDKINRLRALEEI
jgi:hypothetical protein